jgi:hypothetical protein
VVVNSATPWVRWRWHLIGNCSVVERKGSSPAGVHWNKLRSLVPLYRSISCVSLGDGRHTSFWHDSWLPRGPLAVALRVLYSHATCSEVTVADALSRGIVNILVPRMTTAGERELAALEDTVSRITLSTDTDERRLVHCRGPKNKLLTGDLYRLYRFDGVSSPHTTFI